MSGSPIQLRGKSGGVVFDGTQSPGGGSVPQGVVQSVDYLFTEEATAGVYTAPTLDLPKNSYVIDVQWWPLSNSDWAADTAVLDVVDAAIGSVLGAQDVKGGGAFSPNSAAQVAAFAQPYIFPTLTNAADPTSGTLTTTITTTIAIPPVVPAAVTLVRLVYITAPTPAPAVFA